MQKEKIEIIKKYLRQNGVKYYDVQAELIDHFATAVENEQRHNPGLGFKEALHHAHQNFGGQDGFRKFMEKARDHVGKKTWLLVGKTVLRFLSWPYAVLTGAVYLLWWLFIGNGTIGMAYTNYYLIFLGGFLTAFLINEVYLRKVEWYLPRQSNRALALVCYFLYYPPAMALNNLSEPSIHLLAGFFTLLTVFTVCLLMVPRIMTREVQNIYKIST